MSRRTAVIAFAFVVSALLVSAGASVAQGAQLIDRNATDVRLATNTNGEALITYRAGGAVHHVLVWGAINAAAPVKGYRQAKLSVDYAGGWGKYHRQYWKTFGAACVRYDGPPLSNLVAACKAFGGSYWAVQQWPQPLPDLGYAPWTPDQRAQWLEVSHWKGELPTLEAHMGWVYSGYQQIFGRYMYKGQPVFGFGTTSVGAPTDSFGRLIYLDTHNSIYGPGWRRENSFVPHNPTGAFCYGFYAFDPTRGGYQYPPGQTARRGPGVGDFYRLTAAGTGVMPNISITIPALGAYDASKAGERQAADALLRSWGDRQCSAGLGG